MGSTVALEEAKAQNDDAVPEEMITGLKTGLMGPVAGIGDTIDWLTISPILVSMFLPAAKEGNFLAAMAEPINFCSNLYHNRLHAVPAWVLPGAKFHCHPFKGKPHKENY